MSPNDMKLQLEAQVDAIASNESPAISDYQASEFINQGIHSIMKRLIRQGLEYNEYNRQFVAPLKSYAIAENPTADSTNHKNGKLWALEEDFYLMLNETAVSDKRDCIFGQIIKPDILPVTEDYIKINNSDNNKKPFVDPESVGGLVWRVSFGKKTQEHSQKFSELITDGTFNITEYNYRYLRQPRRVIIDLANPENQVYSDIYKEFHDDIINEAALIAIENMGIMSRFQAKAALNTKQGL